MNDSQRGDLLQKLAELYHGLDQDVADLKASVATLKAIAATQLSPADAKAGLEQIQTAQKAAQELDPDAIKRREFSDVIDAVKLIRKHGSHAI